MHTLAKFDTNQPPAAGWWAQDTVEPETGGRNILKAVYNLSESFVLVEKEGEPAVGKGGGIFFNSGLSQARKAYPLLAYAPSMHPENLGDSEFKKRHGVRYPYVAGAMANGITSVRMVEEMGRAGMIGFFGAAGLAPDEVDSAIITLNEDMNGLPYGSNLINSPNDPELEFRIVDCYLKRGMRLASASAYINLTPPLIYYRLKGIHRNEAGGVTVPNKVIGKVSRIEVARRFLSPPPSKIVSYLLDKKLISEHEAGLAEFIPVADDITAEADSGGHTDNRPALSLLPTMLALRDEMMEKHGYRYRICVGLGGGVATPGAASAAFAMGAAYVLTGSVNQSCIEAGTSGTVRRMLAETRQADVAMSPAADMFEQGIKVQVLKRGTMFPQRAAKLYDIYSRYESLDQIPEKERGMLERDLFRCSLESEWENTKAFFLKRDPVQAERAEKDPRRKMALVFRSYLGRASAWAVSGDPDRVLDYQIWCGPCLGAFNEWAKGGFLEKPENRKVVTVAMNILYGAALSHRILAIRNQKADLSPAIGVFKPMPLETIEDLIQ